MRSPRSSQVSGSDLCGTPLAVICVAGSALYGRHATAAASRILHVADLCMFSCAVAAFVQTRGAKSKADAMYLMHCRMILMSTDQSCIGMRHCFERC